MEYLNLNTARAILVVTAVLALLLTLAAGEWVASAVLAVGITAHGLLWLHMWRTGRRDRDGGATTPPGTGTTSA